MFGAILCLLLTIGSAIPNSDGIFGLICVYLVESMEESLEELEVE